ncbi:MAG: folate-binding protein [Alphaproteobacteria bacterium]
MFAMTERHAVMLNSRGLLKVVGPDARGFLQGLISNDVDKLAPGRALWAAFLTPQGKYLHDFFLTTAPGEESILIDCEAARLDDLTRRLGIYKLRAQVELTDVSDDFRVAALFGADALAALGLPAEPGTAAPFGGGIAYTDPRLAALGARAVLPHSGAEDVLVNAGFTHAEFASYDQLRIPLGVPDGSRDLEVERATLLENGFNELHGIDWDKGCFVGQEITSRMKYRALVKRRLVPVEIDGPAPEPGTPVMAGGKEAGVMRSANGGMGLALLRLENLEDALSAGDARVTPKKPAWAEF